MARHTVIPFDDRRYFPEKKRGVIPPSHPRYNAIVNRMWMTFGKTMIGYTVMVAACALAYWYFAFAFAPSAFFAVLGWGSIFWLGIPILGWLFSAKLAIMLQRAKLYEPGDPRAARVKALLDEVFTESLMKFKPPFYVSPDEGANAFATGPFHRWAVVAVTEGFLVLSANLTDEEIKAVLAHELGHVKNYDVALNSMIAVLSMIFFLIVNAGLYPILASLGFIRKISGVNGTWVDNMLSALLGNIFLLPIFYITSQLTRVVQLFVIRSRESGADATAAYITGHPCALATALQKLVDFANNNKPKPGSRRFGLYQVLRPMMFIDPLFDSNKPDPKPQGFGARLKSLWKVAQLTHPPVPERVYHLERMNGGKCPTP